MHRTLIEFTRTVQYTLIDGTGHGGEDQSNHLIIPEGMRIVGVPVDQRGSMADAVFLFGETRLRVQESDSRIIDRNTHLTNHDVRQEIEQSIRKAESSENWASAYDEYMRLVCLYTLLEKVFPEHLRVQMRIAHNRKEMQEDGHHERLRSHIHEHLTEDVFTAIGQAVVAMMDRLGYTYTPPTSEDGEAVWDVLRHIVTEASNSKRSQSFHDPEFPVSPPDLEWASRSLSLAGADNPSLTMTGRKAKARVVLALNPDESGGAHLVGMGYLERGQYPEAKRWFQEAVAIAERSYTPDSIEHPLMWSLHALMLTHCNLCEFSQAIGLGWRLLHMSDRDGLGVRLLLGPLLVASGDMDEFERYLQTNWMNTARMIHGDYWEEGLDEDECHPDDVELQKALDAYRRYETAPPPSSPVILFGFPNYRYSTAEAYSILLYAHDRLEDPHVLRKVLDQALESNHHVPYLLATLESRPEEQSGPYSLGSEEEAIDYLRIGGWDSWQRNHATLYWLLAETRMQRRHPTIIPQNRLPPSDADWGEIIEAWVLSLHFHQRDTHRRVVRRFLEWREASDDWLSQLTDTDIEQYMEYRQYVETTRKQQTRVIRGFRQWLVDNRYV